MKTMQNTEDPVIAGNNNYLYSTYARGVDMLNMAYHYLDLVPKGRDEVGHANPQFWVRRHDEYGDPRYINTEYYDVAKNL
jgi:predicted dithiol-disulfide oxidoreductase (DUF899 family)